MSKKPARRAAAKRRVGSGARQAAGSPHGSALARESERALVEQIRRLLDLPPHERTHFLRVRLPNGGSAV
jgi:hypothetical protein